MTINQDAHIAIRRSPYDDRIEELGQSINQTYIFYGASGREAENRQARADKMAVLETQAGASVERSLFKSKKQYAQGMGAADAVESVATGKLQVSELKAQNLPAAFRGLKEPALEKVLKDKSEERTRLSKELEELGKKRANFLAKDNGSTVDSLDNAILNAVRTQAKNKRFEFAE